MLSYLQKLFCQTALAKGVVEDFQRVYAPPQEGEDEEAKVGQSSGLKRADRTAESAAGGQEAPATTAVLHMDTCKLKHEENAQKLAPMQVSGLLGADSLDNRGEEGGEQPAIHESHDGFDIIEHVESQDGANAVAAVRPP